MDGNIRVVVEAGGVTGEVGRGAKDEIHMVSILVQIC